MMSRLPGNFIEMPSCPGSNYNIDVTDHLLAQKEGAGKRLLLMGHLDTVFPLNNSFQEFYCEGDMMYGPGDWAPLRTRAWRSKLRRRN